MMMTTPCPEAQQDTLQVINVPVRDSVSLNSERTSALNTIQSRDSVPHRLKVTAIKPAFMISDTTSVCIRNSIEDVTFYDSLNLVTRIRPANSEMFPVLFVEKNRIMKEEKKAFIVKHLRSGTEIPLRQLHNDWIILIILATGFLFSLIWKSSDKVLQGVQRFFLFRGINDLTSRDTSGLFNWDATITNLVSFIVLGLFGFYLASYYGITLSGMTGLLQCLISVMIIITAVTLRHFVCLITGSVSGEKEVFREYLMSVYQFYRFSALFNFFIVILISYTTIFPIKSCLSAGIIIFATLYLIRILRLFIIFINKNISLFYLILYLCALEILPVVISVKYISGFV
jgi:hypothetical protein